MLLSLLKAFLILRKRRGMVGRFLKFPCLLQVHFKQRPIRLYTILSKFDLFLLWWTQKALINKVDSKWFRFICNFLCTYFNVYIRFWCESIHFLLHSPSTKFICSDYWSCSKISTIALRSFWSTNTQKQSS